MLHSFASDFAYLSPSRDARQRSRWNEDQSCFFGNLLDWIFEIGQAPETMGSYDESATSRTPGTVVLILDLVGSRGDLIDDHLINRINGVLRNIIRKLVQRSTKGEIISPRYEVGVLAYGAPMMIFPNGFVSISQAGNWGHHLVWSQNRRDVFRIVNDGLMRVHENTTGMPAPLVCHITSGLNEEDDSDHLLRQIQEITFDDGRVLIETIYVGDQLVPDFPEDPLDWRGARDAESFTASCLQRLARTSSRLPGSYAENLARYGLKMAEGSLMLIPWTFDELVEGLLPPSGATPTR